MLQKKNLAKIGGGKNERGKILSRSNCPLPNNDVAEKLCPLRIAAPAMFLVQTKTYENFKREGHTTLKGTPQMQICERKRHAFVVPSGSCIDGCIIRIMIYAFVTLNK